jgi:replicative superfamily II helicase
MSRWERILDQKPQELKDYVLGKVAEQLVEDLRDFPPRIEEWLDDTLRARYAQVLDRAGRPELDTYRVACEMAREEMLREYELIDRFCRSDEYRRLLPTELEQQTAHFITRYLVDSALAFQEYGQDKFKRRDLVTLMEKVEDGLLRGYRLRL